MKKEKLKNHSNTPLTKVIRKPKTEIRNQKRVRRKLKSEIGKQHPQVSKITTF